MRFLVLAGLLFLVGCTTVRQSDYRPKTAKEKRAYSEAERSIKLTQVQADFDAFRGTNLVWAGLIKDVQFKETERTVQVAFQIEHHHFDWLDHGGGKPFRLTESGEGDFIAGWIIQKPTRISSLKTQARPGFMILVYGDPYKMNNSVIQLSAKAVRPIKAVDFEVVERSNLELVEHAGE